MTNNETSPLIQVVDDNATMRRMVKDALEESGFRVTEANSGPQLLSTFETLKPDLILLDVVMPEMDGFTVCRELRQLQGGEYVPVMMMTSLNDVESIHKAFDAGATDFITKPINWVIFGYRIRYILRSSRTLHELFKSRERLSKAQAIARLGHWELDLSSGKFQCSGELIHLLGIDPTRSDLGLEDLSAPIRENDRIEFESALGHAMAKQTSFAINVRVDHPTGEERIIYYQADIIHDATQDHSIMMGTLQDVTELKKAEEQVRFLAFYDGLTGLANRFLFKDHLTHALSSAQRQNRLAALIFLDLDRFKRVNDTLGHQVGDMLLQKIAERLRTCIRKSDFICRAGASKGHPMISRLGGDEFTILLSDVEKPEHVARLARRILDTIARPLRLLKYDLSVTASLGISLYPYDGQDADHLIKNADTAMYSAKKKGRGNYQFYRESMNAAALERFNLENDINKALKAGDFLLYYQPQYLTETEALVGAEALIRWQHPRLGFIPPSKFIRISEETGQISPINRWVIKAACEEYCRWKETYDLEYFQMAVNLSGQLDSAEDIVKTVKDVLNNTSINPRNLEVELTENIIMQKDKHTVYTLFQLKDLGLQIAIDDFGTGYSSLSYLNSFPIDTLKIDKSFVQEMSGNANDNSIVRAIIAMAHSLDIEVIAEGVETRQQFELLKDLGCGRIQGYLFSPPVPPEDFTKLLSPLEQKQAPKTLRSKHAPNTEDLRM